ncbi:MAG: hypothetical protein EBQ95_00005, partial [Gammaproteobacteria bacterium]|nr:hypothetical protein [Gammaproteobacteria bacterium]
LQTQIDTNTTSINKLNLYTNATNTNVINVKASPYNAVGDGVADDTTAINNAMSALPANNGILLFPSGKYKISNTLVVSSKTKLIVVSDNAEIIVTQTGTSAMFFSECKNLHAFIGHITFTTTSSAASPTKIAVILSAGTQTNANPDLFNITVLGAFQYGLYMYNNYIGYTNGSVANFTFDGENTGVNGIYLTSACQYVEVLNCKINNLLGTGILMVGGNNTITGGIITNCRIGIWVDSITGGNLDHSLINGITCNHCRAAGIFVRSIQLNMAIVNCKIWAANGADNLTEAVNVSARGFHYGIYLENVKGMVITGNTFAHNNSIDMGIDGINTTLINNNVFRSVSTSYVIYEWYTAGVSSYNNQICNNTFNGTTLNATRMFLNNMANDSCYNYMIKDNIGENLSNNLYITVNSGDYYIGQHNNYIIDPFYVSTADGVNPSSQTANIYILPHATGTAFTINFSSTSGGSFYTWLRYKTNSTNTPNIVGTGITYTTSNKCFRLSNNITQAVFTPLSNGTFTNWCVCGRV